MTFWILLNNYAAAVFQHLQRVCLGDPGLTLDANTGRVSYSQSVSGVGPNMVAALSGTVIPVGLRGENSDWPNPDKPGKVLAQSSGLSVGGGVPLNQIDVVIDGEDCYGRGGYVFDGSGSRIPAPMDVVLFHELGHAMDFLMGAFNNPETDTITVENQYRQSLGLPSRRTALGGCNAPAPPLKAPDAADSSHASFTGENASTVRSYLDTDHVLNSLNLPPSARAYRVFISNATTDTFDEIVIFYKRVGLPGVVYLTEPLVGPGQVRAFMLGAAENMESYVVGFFLAGQNVAQIPSQGNMTPALASQLKPSDTDLCLDSWEIY